MSEGLYQVFFFFFLYAFLGWCSEVVFHAVTFGKFINRGFLNGPVCPIYGVGVVVVLLLLEPWKKYGILLFLASMLLTSALECLTGFCMEKLFHARWWDYSEEPFHLGPYVCLKFSLIWGFACVFVVRVLHPFLIFVVGLLPPLVGKVILLLLAMVLLADFCATVTVIRRMFRKLEKLDEIASEIHAISDRIGEKLSDSALIAMEKSKDNREKIEERKEEFGERLEEQKERSLAKLEERKAELQRRMEENSLSHRRILKAFPGLQSNRHPISLQALKRYAEKKEKK